MRTIIATLLIFLPFTQYAQSKDLMHFDQISMKRGQFGDVIRDIIEDQHGFVWVAGQEGIGRYDGHEVEFYTFVSHDSLRQFGAVFDLHLDQYGKIWARAAMGVFRYDHGSDRFEKITSLIYYSPKNKFGQDSLGNLWTYSNKGLFRYSIHDDQSLG